LTSPIVTRDTTFKILVKLLLKCQTLLVMLVKLIIMSDGLLEKQKDELTKSWSS
jgi:hypothetical protein